MVAIVGGNTLGLNLGSMASLGQRGVFGSSTQGRSGERAYVNVATGNLAISESDGTYTWTDPAPPSPTPPGVPVARDIASRHG